MSDWIHGWTGTGGGDELGPLQLAWLGDAVWELHQRLRHCRSPGRADVLHRAVVEQVCADAQARALKQLEPLLGGRPFLDSDDLQDLTMLQQYVRDSRCVLLLQTKSVLTRPWCIVELLTAIEARVPIVAVSITSGAHAYDFASASAFLTHLDTALDAETRAYLETSLEIDVSDAAFKLTIM